MVGADFARERWEVGVVVSRSLGEGGYRSAEGAAAVEASVTGLYPYGGMALSERISVWAAGYGAGVVTVTPEGERPLTADMKLAMGAAGFGTSCCAPERKEGFRLR